ncbi:MAG: hypothetical protein ACREST_05340 [Steroidobacteraceae bacterium]
MRIVSRTARSVREQEREKTMRKREAAGTLATAFPRSEQVRIHLQFVSNEGPAPAARTHALYPSAQAYFEFACPHGDCDGSIDLNAVALALLRKSGSQADGTLHCPGTRTAGGGTRPPCNQRVDYWIAARYQPLSRAAS